MIDNTNEPKTGKDQISKIESIFGKIPKSLIDTGSYILFADEGGLNLSNLIAGIQNNDVFALNEQMRHWRNSMRKNNSMHTNDMAKLVIAAICAVRDKKSNTFNWLMENTQHLTNESTRSFLNTLSIFLRIINSAASYHNIDITLLKEIDPSLSHLNLRAGDVSFLLKLLGFKVSKKDHNTLYKKLCKKETDVTTLLHYFAQQNCVFAVLYLLRDIGCAIGYSDNGKSPSDLAKEPLKTALQTYENHFRQLWHFLEEFDMEGLAGTQKTIFTEIGTLRQLTDGFTLAPDLFEKGKEKEHLNIVRTFLQQNPNPSLILPCLCQHPEDNHINAINITKTVIEYFQSLRIVFPHPLQPNELIKFPFTGFSPNSSTNGYNGTMLHMVTDTTLGNPSMLQKYFEQAKSVDIFCPDLKGITPLLQLILHGHAEMTKALIKHALKTNEAYELLHSNIFKDLTPLEVAEKLYEKQPTKYKDVLDCVHYYTRSTEALEKTKEQKETFQKRRRNSFPSNKKTNDPETHRDRANSM